MPKSRAGGDVCEGSGRDRDTRSKHVESRSPQVIQKSLSRKDMKDIENDKLYISNPDATIFCSGAVDLIFYHNETKRWTSRYSSDGEGCYLTRGWSQFARAKKLSDGDIITFSAIKSQSRRGLTEETAFTVGVIPSRT